MASSLNNLASFAYPIICPIVISCISLNILSALVFCDLQISNAKFHSMYCAVSNISPNKLYNSFIIFISTPLFSTNQFYAMCRIYNNLFSAINITIKCSNCFYCSMSRSAINIHELIAIIFNYYSVIL